MLLASLSILVPETVLGKSPAIPTSRRCVGCVKSNGCNACHATRTTPLLVLLTPHHTRQNYICAERDKKRRYRCNELPDPKREKQELSLLVGRSDKQRMDVRANCKPECSQ